LRCAAACKRISAGVDAGWAKRKKGKKQRARKGRKAKGEGRKAKGERQQAKGKGQQAKGQRAKSERRDSKTAHTVNFYGGRYGDGGCSKKYGTPKFDR